MPSFFKCIHGGQEILPISRSLSRDSLTRTIVVYTSIRVISVYRVDDITPATCVFGDHQGPFTNEFRSKNNPQPPNPPKAGNAYQRIVYEYQSYEML